MQGKSKQYRFHMNLKTNYYRMKYSIIAMFFVTLICLPYHSIAQDKGGTVIQGRVISDLDKEPLTGVSVSELDANNRVVSGTYTDIDGNYVLRVNNTAHKLSFAYLGLKKQEVKIAGRKVVNVSMADDVVSIQEVKITGTRKSAQGGYIIPTREIATATQTISSKEFEGLQVSSIDDALQGRIAGLDIVANSSDPGSTTSMRIRGVSSINGDNEPLIVLNGIPYSIEIDPNFDFSNSNSEQYANMLSINPDDILEITVLKDAAASAIWGSKGANGVIMITTKKGVTGKTRVEYTYRYTRTKQPLGRKMLTGNDYTMYIKEAYLNPRQDDEANDKDEYNYDQNFPDYENYNNNINWVDEVTQTGHIHDHYLVVSGGGERALYRVAGGYLTQDGTVIGQEFDRFSARANFEYSVSDRIRFFSELSLTYSDNQRNYENLLGIAYSKMPNASVYNQDQYGNNTNEYYNIPRTSTLHKDQKDLKNPVALANLATNRLESTRILPVFGLRYDLLDPNEQMLRLNFNVSFDTNSDKTRKFLPMAATNLFWADENANRGEDINAERLNIFNENSILWTPNFKNKDHSLTLYEAVQISIGKSSSQGIVTSGLPSSEATDPSAEGFIEGGSISRNSSRNIAFMTRGHYAYKGRYIFDGTIRTEGSTRFGEDNRWGNFPGLSLKWIISDEKFMEPTKKWLSMLAVRPSWGISGNQPKSDYLHFSRYSTYGSYMEDMPAVKPNSLRLNNLKWETATQFNYGAEIAFFDDALYFDLNYYTKEVEDMLFEKVGVSSISGFGELSYINGGTMKNEGWEINFQANRIFRIKDFSMDFSLNLANNVNTIVQLNPSLLEGYNSDFNFENGSYLTRIQEGNSFGSIYGFRFKGTYKYDKYETALDKEGSLLDANGKPYAPFATDANGNVIMDQKGNPKPIYFAYNKVESRYQFRGGDAVYEDINHDGVIDELDMVYLGNANPKLNGGFGPTFRYKNFSCKLFFNFRYGNKIVNEALMHAENMYSDNNQSTTVNWRWRKDGDPYDMPRALYRYGYNWLGSDRYVEDGSFMRFKYLTFSYTVPTSILKQYAMNKLTFYLTFNNLYVWTKYKGVDPEIGYGSLANKGISYDKSSTPRTKDFTLGVSIGF